MRPPKGGLFLCRVAPCTRRGQSQSQSGSGVFRGEAGRCRMAGTPWTHPWGLGRGIHAADTPPSDTSPPSTVSR
ncbi:conserved hypothetical protein [Stenotrophomonas maltophilia]